MEVLKEGGGGGVAGKPQRWRRHTLLRELTLLSIMYIELIYRGCFVWFDL